ncbi:MAG: transporter suffix domain-containing protein [Candidatus Parcubacteria bacterium]|uniref:transporter suffix domain-containing protein n=1 Tax=Phormidesmis priestleyi TaxID=268141 RepID=UPI000839E9F5|nr:transporter suffix domain-containing protein [Phormidesmis priestleyi]MBC7824507.1 transporter suffix domain-containing protein [Leptolyngbyaceae cyanobacterium LF-bin-113]
MRKIGIGLILVSFLPWIAVAALPFLALSIGQKAVLIPILIGSAEVIFWIGILVVGKEVAERYRRWLNPRYLWERIRQRFR